MGRMEEKARHFCILMQWKHYFESVLLLWLSFFAFCLLRSLPSYCNSYFDLRLFSQMRFKHVQDMFLKDHSAWHVFIVIPSACFDNNSNLLSQATPVLLPHTGSQNTTAMAQNCHKSLHLSALVVCTFICSMSCWDELTVISENDFPNLFFREKQQRGLKRLLISAGGPEGRGKASEG